MPRHLSSTDLFRYYILFSFPRQAPSHNTATPPAQVRTSSRREFIKENKKKERKQEEKKKVFSFFLGRFLGRVLVFFLFFLIVFLFEFLFSYFLVFFYKFPSLFTRTSVCWLSTVSLSFLELFCL